MFVKFIAARARSTIVPKTWQPIDARNFGFIAMTSSIVCMYVPLPLHACQCDQYHTSLQHTSLTLDIHVLINWHPSKQGIRWPVSRDHIAGSSLELTKVSFFLKLTADEVLVFDWIAGSTQVNSHKRGFIFRALSVTRPGYTVILHQLWFDVYHDSCGPHWRLRRYSSQASEWYKLKAECLFLICLELLFSLYCNFWHISRSSDKVTCAWRTYN